MEIQGVVLNNSSKTKHIFQRAVYPGQTVDLQLAYDLLGKGAGREEFLNWLEEYIPDGWEIHTTKESAQEKVKEQQPDEPSEEEVPSKKYLSSKKIADLSARDIANLRIKDEPRRIINQIDSIHKLRRALTLCNKMERKESISALIRNRINKIK